MEDVRQHERILDDEVLRYLIDAKVKYISLLFPKYIYKNNKIFPLYSESELEIIEKMDFIIEHRLNNLKSK